MHERQLHNDSENMRIPRMTSAEIRKWERQLAKEGLPAEPKPDKGKIALEKIHGIRKSDSMKIYHALQRYWAGRVTGGFYGAHKLVVQEIADSAGVKASQVDGNLVEQIGIEMGNIEARAHQIASKVSKAGGTPRRMKETARKNIQEEFGNLDPDALDMIVEKIEDKFFNL
ncbi:MAG: hypothetical protein ABIH21_05605 [Patescibacteria group bacterium]